MLHVDKLTDIRHTIGDAAMYEQLAEECMELAHACLKKARKLRGDNFTPKTFEEIDENLKEELADVTLCMTVVNVMAFEDLLEIEDRENYKIDRWYERVCGENNETERII